MPVDKFKRSVQKDAQLTRALSISGKDVGSFFFCAGSAAKISAAAIQSGLNNYYLSKQGATGTIIEIPGYVQAHAHQVIMEDRRPIKGKDRRPRTADIRPHAGELRSTA